MTKAPKTSFTAYQKFVILLLAFLQFTIVLDFMIISPLGDILIKSLSIGTKQFGLVVSAYAFSAAISGFVAAAFADKFDRKKLLVFFYTGFIIGTIFCGMANSFITLLLARIVTGIFGGVIGSVLMAIVVDLFAPAERGRVMGTIQMAFGVSQILGIPLGLKIADKFNWHFTFYFIVIIAVLVLIVMLIKLKPITAHLQLQTSKNPLIHLWQTIGNKQYQIGFLAISFLAIGGFMIMPFSSAFLVNNVHLKQQDLFWVFMCTGFASLLIMPLVGKLSDKFDRYYIFLVGSIIAIIMVIVFTNLPVVPLSTVIIVNMVLFAGVMGRIVPASALNSMIAQMKDRGAYMSITSSLQQMSGGLGALVAGLIVHQSTKESPIEHYNILGYIVAFIFILCIYLVYRVSKLIKQKQA